MFRFGDPGGRVYGSTGSYTNVLLYWTNAAGGPGANIAVQSGAGRISGSCLRYTVTNGGQNNNLYFSKTLDNQQTWGLAFAIRPFGLPSTACVIAVFGDGATTQISLIINTLGTLSVTRNGTVLGTTTNTLTVGNWTHIEMKIKIDPSVGTVYLAMNGVQQINLTAQNTRASANSYAQVLSFGIITSSAITTTDFDDIIVYDGQTTDPNGFTGVTGPIGDCNLTTLLPNGVGTTTQFTPDTGSNYARVNEAIPDSDTSYVESSTVNNVDTYATADLSGTTSTVVAVAVVNFARKTDVGLRSLKASLRSNGGNTNHATDNGLSTSYQYYFSSFDQDPNNGSPANWTVSSVNALEIGQVVSS